jgi:hypothetical protein
VPAGGLGAALLNHRAQADSQQTVEAVLLREGGTPGTAPYWKG